MNTVRCNNGHFYDADRYGACPHCSPQGAAPQADKTVALTNAFEDKPTAKLTIAPSVPSSLQEAVQNASKEHVSVSQDDTAHTVAFYEKKMGKDPVVGWLVCIKGPVLGQDFRLKSGRNFIGRSREMDVSIEGDNTVSRDRHAIIIYEPKNHLYLIQNGDSKELCYLNGEVVLVPQTIKINDVLTIGNTELMFFPCCDKEFNWNKDESKQE